MFAVIREGWVVAEDGLKEASYIFVSRAVRRILFRANLIDSLRSGFSCGRFEWKNKVAKWTSQGISKYCQLLGLKELALQRWIAKIQIDYLHQFSIVSLTLGSDLKFHAVLITSDRSIPRGWWQRNTGELVHGHSGVAQRFVVSHLWGSILQRYQSCALAIPNNDRGCYYNPEDRATQERSKMRTRDGPIPFILYSLLIPVRHPGCSC